MVTRTTIFRHQSGSHQITRSTISAAISRKIRCGTRGITAITNRSGISLRSVVARVAPNALPIACLSRADPRFPPTNFRAPSRKDLVMCSALPRPGTVRDEPRPEPDKHLGSPECESSGGPFSRQGLHATYAHEIAHLLLDRTTALPLAEVMGGRAVGTGTGHSGPTRDSRTRTAAA